MAKVDEEISVFSAHEKHLQSAVPQTKPPQVYSREGGKLEYRVLINGLGRTNISQHVCLRTTHRRRRILLLLTKLTAALSSFTSSCNSTYVWNFVQSKTTTFDFWTNTYFWFQWRAKEDLLPIEREMAPEVSACRHHHHSAGELGGPATNTTTDDDGSIVLTRGNIKLQG